jgi:hypothetical protein
MRPRTILAIAATAVLAFPVAADAGGKKHDNGHGWNKGRWDARAHIKPSASGENARGAAYLKRGTNTLTVALRIGKLDPNTAYAAQIEQGACPTGGAAALALPPLYTDEHGTVRLWITLPAPAGSNLAVNGYAINVRAFDAQGAPAGSVVCGDIKGSNGTKAAGKVRPSVDGGKVHGSVFAKQGPTSLRVEIHLDDLEPGSTHANHIHVGSCTAQGDVVVPLPDAVADADGEYHAIHTIANPAFNVVNGGYYYNLHAAASPTPGDGIACSDLRPFGKKKKGPWWFGPRWWGW